MIVLAQKGCIHDNRQGRQNIVAINQLIAQMLDETKRNGYSDATIWQYYQPAMRQSRKYYEQTGRAEYSPDTMDKYVNLHRERSR